MTSISKQSEPPRRETRETSCEVWEGGGSMMVLLKVRWVIIFFFAWLMIIPKQQQQQQQHHHPGEAVRAFEPAAFSWRRMATLMPMVTWAPPLKKQSKSTLETKLFS